MLFRIPTSCLLLATLVTSTEAFLSYRKCIQLLPTHVQLRWVPSSPLNSAANDDEEEQMMDLPLRPEPSRMTEYVSQFLGKESVAGSAAAASGNHPLEDLETATHLIAIPLDTNYELLLELESVQRAILYHCPILADACIPSAVTRLPLLYVKASNTKTAEATRWLSATIRRLVERHLFQPVADDDDDDISEDMLNEDRIQPLTMTFQSLEIEGNNNNALHTVGIDGSQRLANLVQDLKTTVEQQGWQVAMPADPNGKDNTFRPRIRFMEIPKEFDDNLSKFKEEGTEIKEEDFEFLKSSEGGNGISPIFWCQWWDDVFGRNIRMKEIGIYPRNIQERMASDLSYARFYMPYDTIDLPAPTSGLLRSEEKFQKYQDDRMGEQEKEMEKAIDTTAREGGDDLLLGKTQRRLEQLYQSSSGLESGYVEADAIENVVEEETLGLENSLDAVDTGEKDDEAVVSTGLQQKASPGDFVEDWTKQRIRQVIESQESEKVRKPVKKDMPPVAENLVFKAYKEGSLTPKAAKSKPKQRDLGAYPNPAYFAGIWKVISSPTGFPAEDSSNDSSENLVLRVDGTVAGGPILDPATRQKAAGGTWKLLESENGEVQLRVRLVIPPKKERVIEMIGVVNRVSMKAPAPMASRAFGIPYLEEMAKLSSSDLEDIMLCGGEVFIEDAVTKKNREQIGDFSLTKLQGPRKPGEYTITIPKPS